MAGQSDSTATFTERPGSELEHEAVGQSDSTATFTPKRFVVSAVLTR